MSNKKVVTRFAPSPTGFMHIGGVRTALYAWAYARKHGGTFILRIEDTDKEREVEGSIPHIIETLKWIGIEWDEGVDIGGPAGEYLQSKRLDSHKKYAQELIEKGFAYADPYTTEEVDAFRKKAEVDGKPFLYRDHRPENPPVWDGSQPLRLKVTDIKISEWHDVVRGDLSAGPEALDDFVLIKSDGYPTYNFAHIIDDLEMGVTHVVRTDEFISSTPKYLSLYAALGITPPEFVTLPPIMAPDGKKKLGKRDGAKDSLEYRNEGFLPAAMMNFLALIGWNPGDEREIFTPEEFIQEFDLAKVHKSGGGFNEEKLHWFNKEHLKLLPSDKQKEFVKNYLSKEWLDACGDEKFSRAFPMIFERISYGKEIQDMEARGELGFVITKSSLDISTLNWNGKQEGSDTKKYLESILAIAQKCSDWTIDNLKEKIFAFADTLPKRGAALHPLRYGLTGLATSPDPFTVMYILGQEESLSRIQIAIDLL